MRYARTMLIDLHRGVKMVRTVPKQCRNPRDYYFQRCGNAWLVWIDGRDPTLHVMGFAEENLDGEVRTKRVARGQTSLDEFDDDGGGDEERVEVDEQQVVLAD